MLLKCSYLFKSDFLQIFKKLHALYGSFDIQPATVENKVTNADIFRQSHQKLFAKRMHVVDC